MENAIIALNNITYLLLVLTHIKREGKRAIVIKIKLSRGIARRVDYHVLV